ncbi:MAG: universal stress protein [Deltaproteobacteria bacterium]|nr:universal stress protein [Deltaproteobacteria bacterium]
MSTALQLESDPLALIVVATDFSETATLALDRALDIAQRHRSEIALVHVMQPDLPPLAAPEMIVIPPNYEDLLRAACLEGLQHAADRVRAAGIAVSEHLEQGRPAASIAAAAEALAADLILIGTRGNTGFKHLLLGSVAEEVVRVAQCPVLTVHPGDDRPIEPVRSLLFPTDFSPAAEQALAAATRLLIGSEKTKILLLHTYHIAPAVVPLGGFGGGVAPVLVDDAHQLAEQATRPSAEALRTRGFDVEVLIERGDPAEIVIEKAAEHDVDLIVMGTRGHSKIRQFLLGSTAERVVEHAPCPVLTVHQRDEPAD